MTTVIVLPGCRSSSHSSSYSSIDAEIRRLKKIRDQNRLSDVLGGRFKIEGYIQFPTEGSSQASDSVREEETTRTSERSWDKSRSHSRRHRSREGRDGRHHKGSSRHTYDPPSHRLHSREEIAQIAAAAGAAAALHVTGASGHKHSADDETASSQRSGSSGRRRRSHKSRHRDEVSSDDGEDEVTPDSEEESEEEREHRHRSSGRHKVPKEIRKVAIAAAAAALAGMSVSKPGERSVRVKGKVSVDS